MGKIKLSIPVTKGPAMEIDAWCMVKDLAVHRDINNEKLWAITHIPTGHAVKNGIQLKKIAVEMVKHISKLMDWSFDKPEDITGRPGCKEVTEYLFPGNNFVTPTACMATPHHTVEELEKFKEFFGVRMPIDGIGAFDLVSFDYWLHHKHDYKEKIHGSIEDFVRHHWGADACWFIKGLIGVAPKNPEEPKMKNEQLAQDWGYLTVVEMLEANLHETMVPGICMEDGCDYSTDVEKDQAKGWCEICGKNNVQSCFEIEGLI